MKKVTPQKVFDLEYFVELSPDLICIASYDGYLKKINPAVVKTLGYSYDELLETPIDSFIYPADRQITAEKRHQLTEGKILMNFENRWVAKNGAIVWLAWTSVPIERDRLIFAIAKNVTYQKQIDEYERISDILEMIHDDHKDRFPKDKTAKSSQSIKSSSYHSALQQSEPSQADQLWLNTFESVVRKHTGKLHMNLNTISDELAMGERQLYRHVKRILNITPNKLVRVIRLQLAWEAIASGKYRTISEISHIAGFKSRAHFSKLFKNIYGIEVSELL